MNVKKQLRQPLSVSYLDVFFLLLAGFVLSLGIYFVGREAKASSQSAAVYRVEVTARYDSRVYESIPAEGELLFDENGKRIGEILKSETYQAEGKTQVLLECRMQGKVPALEENIRIETAKSLNVAKVLSVSEEENP